MKLVKIAGLVAILGGVAAAEDTIWVGTSGKSYVKSGGYWFFFNDSSDNGKATINNFPLESSIANGGMYNIFYTINPSQVKGTGGYSFVGAAFNWLTPKGPAPQTWSQICVEYSLSGTIPFQLQINNDHALTQDNNYLVTLPSSAGFIKRCYDTSSFVQLGSAGLNPLTTCMAQSTGIQFEAVAKPKATAWSDTFKIKSVTTLQAGETAIHPSASEVRNGPVLRQAGATLSLSGMEGPAQLRISDLQGRLLTQRIMESGSSLSLADLAKGVYFVRIESGTDRINRRIAIP
jgi:hypothetical protein